MEIITVHTTQNIDIDYEIGGLGERIVARLIDIGVFIPFLFVGIFLNSAGSVVLGAYYIFLLVVFVFYDLVCEVFFNGQSLGKRVMKIRVISLDGARPKFSQYLLRWLFRMVDFTITWPGAVALISAAVTENGQRIGDLVAGTVLIKTAAHTKMNNLIFANTEDTYQPVFAQASRLTDKDINLVHEVIENYVKTGNNVIVYNLADRIREHLSVSMPPGMNSMQFLQTIVKDYSHITAHADIL